MRISDLEKKRVLILGFSREGRDTLKFLRRLFPKKVIGIADKSEASGTPKKNRKIRLYFGKDYLKSLKNYDIVIKSPGISPKVIAPFITGKQKITSQTEIFFENCPSQIIGITGTKGKGTTAKLIFQILKKAGLKPSLVGNIGKPVLQLLFSAGPKDIFIYELSSHQLRGLKQSPQIGVWLNVYPDHLDYYKNFKEYVRAKANVCLHQKKSDYFIYNADDKIVAKFARRCPARKIALSLKKEVTRKIASQVKKLPALKAINPIDLAAAVMTAKIVGISEKNIFKALRNFKNLPHRLEYMGIFRGIKFYDDSASTIPESTIFALNVLGKEVQTIMLGGWERKKMSFKNLAKRILKSRIKNVILFPTTGQKIWQEIKRQRGRSSLRHFYADSMPEAVKIAYQNTKKGKICLLSCASASFSIFRDYVARGNLFQKYVRYYARK